MVNRAPDGDGPSNPREARGRRDRRQPAGLEIDQDIDFHGRAHAVQRACWLLLALVLLAGLLGAFGKGPLSRAVAGEPGDVIWLEYDRFGRDELEDELRIRLGQGAATDGRARVWIDRAYLEAARIERITPEPERVEVGPDHFLYIFPVADPGRATALTFHIRPEGPGPRRGRVGLRDGPGVAFWQFIYP